jgi:hypothetical protein
MGAKESSRRDDAENPSLGVDYYQLLQLKEDASADEIKVIVSTMVALDSCLCYPAIFPTSSFNSSP